MAKNNLRCAVPRGFTLIEMMVVVAIVGILTMIAVPAYRNSVMKSHRFLAKAALLDLASHQEKYYMSNHTYASSLSSLSYSSEVKEGGGSIYYTLTMSESAASGTTPSAFSATATPSGTQVGDKCGSFTIDSSGNHGNTNATATNCW